jgi:hypothetical protein
MVRSRNLLIKSEIEVCFEKIENLLDGNGGRMRFRVSPERVSEARCKKWNSYMNL